MRITSRKINTAHLTPNEEALVRSQAALEFKDTGDYKRSSEVMRPIWRGVGNLPEISGLHPSVAAEVFLCTGILTRWIGGKNGVGDAQEAAKNLITKSIMYYESVSDVKKVAAARVELACCYWREGALNEARTILTSALTKLTTAGNTRAKALFRLAIIEWSASRYSESLRILTENAELFQKITNHAVKGTYHNQLAMVLRKVAPNDAQDSYFDRVLNEYQSADREFKVAGNVGFRADVKNNIGNVFRELGHFK
jgi:tetratricopeptide (TPR) repeat protein